MRNLSLRISLLLLLTLTSVKAFAIEVVRQKNIATRIVFPIVDADGDFVTSAAGLDSEIDEYADGSNPTGFADCTNEATEIGTTGIYYLNLTSTEMNQDYNVVQVKTSTSGAKTQVILVRTIAGDPKAAATTTTAGRTIDVATTGEVGVDFSNINGTIDSSEIGTDAIGAAQIAADAIGSSEIATDAIGAAEIAASAITSSEAANLDAAVSSRLASASISLSGGAVTVGTNNDKTGYALSSAGITAIWDKDISAYSTAGYAGTYLKGAGSAGDPWVTALPGAYSAGTAGYIIGTNLNATVSSRASQTSLDTVDDYVDTEVAAIKAKTDSLTFTTANKVDARTFTNDDKTGYSLAADQAVNVTKWSGTTVATPDTAGYPKVTIKSGTGTGEVSLASGTVTIGTNNDKTGYRLSATGVDDIWDEAQSGHTTAGTFGKYLDAQVSTIGGGSLTAADIWNYNISAYSTAGLAGTYLKGAGNAGDPWQTSLPGTYTGSQAGKYLIDLIKQTRGR